MPDKLKLGDRARARGPLKPSGQIRIGDRMVIARSQGEWIDSDSEVEIIGGNQDQVLVRRVDVDTPAIAHRGQPLPQNNAESTAPIHAPPAWVETIRMDWIGAVGGAIVAVLIWWNGEPLSLMFICVPASGYLAGLCFRKFVNMPAEAAGPYADHRPVASGLALAILLTACLGAAFGYGIEPGYVGVSCGLVLGTVTAGIVAFLLAVGSQV